MPRPLRCRIFPRNCNLPRFRRIQFLQAPRTMDHLHPLAADLCRYLCRFPADPRLPHLGGQVANRRHRFRHGLLRRGTNRAIRVQRDHLRRRGALHRRPVLLHIVHAPQCHDGV